MQFALRDNIKKTGKLSMPDMFLWVLAVALAVFKLPLGCFQSPVWGYLWSVSAVAGLVYGSVSERPKISLQAALYLIPFLIIAVVSLSLNNYAPGFRCDMRLGYLALTILLMSPLLGNRTLERLRLRIFIVFCCVITAATLVSGIIYVHTAVQQGLPDAFCGVYIHHMTASFMFALSFAICLGVFLTAKGRITLIHMIILAVSFLDLLLILAGGSRMALLGAGTVLLFFAVILHNKRVLVAIGFGAVCLLVVSLFPDFLETLLSQVISKFNSATANHSLTFSRDALWQARIDEFLSSPWLGIGVGNQTVFAHPWDNPEIILATGRIEPGSSWLAVLSQTGVFGLVLITLYTIRMSVIFGKKMRKKCRRHTLGESSFKGQMEYMTTIVLSGVFLVLCVISLTEGYILAAGSALCTLYWLSTGIMGASAESR